MARANSPLLTTNDAGTLEHANDAPDRTSWFLVLGAYDEVGDLGANGARGPLVRTRGGHEGVEAAMLVLVEPTLDGPPREAHDAAVRRHHVVPSRGVREVCATITVLEPRADERPEHAEPKEPDGSPCVVVHDRILKEDSRHKRWDRIQAPRCPTSTRRMPRSHETNASLESMKQLRERSQPRTGNDASDLGMQIGELGARRVESNA